MVWLIPSAETAQFSVIVLMTYLISAGGFMHIIAGSVEAFLLLLNGELHWSSMLTDFVIAGACRKYRRRHRAFRADRLCAGHEGNLTDPEIFPKRSGDIKPLAESRRARPAPARLSTPGPYFRQHGETQE